MKNRFKFLLLIFLYNVSFSKEINMNDLIKKYEKELGTNKIIVTIMDNSNQNIVYSHNKELGNSYKFEPSSLLKPIVMSIALNNDLIKDDEFFFLYNELGKDKNGYYPKGIFKIGNLSVEDNKEYNKNYFNYEQILINSSSIGMLQIAQRINYSEYEKGLKDFGFLSTEDTKQNNPYLENMQTYDDEDINLSKAIISFGHGFLATHNEILNAYAIFNTDKVTTLDSEVKLRIRKILIEKAENEIDNVLIRNTKIGFYTGTSQIAKKRQYLNKYIVSCFGIVDIDAKKYTIGITIIEPTLKKNNGYYKYAKYSVIPIFESLLEKLII